MNLTIYDKNKHGESELQKYITKGKYIFHFRVPLVDCSGLIRNEPFTLSVKGKLVVCEKIHVPENDPSKVEVHVTLAENPVHLAVVLGGVAAIGIIAVVFLERVEKVINVATPLAALTVGGLYLWTSR